MLMQFVNKGSTECRTRLPRFWYFFKKVQKERLEENTSEQLRLRTAVEFDGERKRVFAPNFLQVTQSPYNNIKQNPKLQQKRRM